MDSGLTGAYEGGPSLESYKRLFTEAREQTRASREKGQLYRRYYDNKQYDDATVRRKRARKEPTFSINRVRPGVEALVGVVKGGRADPRGKPRASGDQNAAEIATKALGFISDQNHWPNMKLKVARNAFIEGTAAVIVQVDRKSDVQFKRIRFEEFVWDPYSREDDFSDASYMAIAKWQWLDEIIANYPEQEAPLRDLCTTGAETLSDMADRPGDGATTWVDPKRKRLFLVEMYKRDRGEWLKCTFVGSLKLEEGPSPYLDADGRPCCPIVAQSIFVDDDNNRYGVVEDMIGPQDEINTYRTKAAWLATFRQLQESGPDQAGVDPEEARKEAAKPDGVIPFGLQVVDNAGRFQMDMALLEDAYSQIERIGPNPAILARGNASSGRQDLIRQQAGLTELAHLFGAIDHMEQRLYERAWLTAQQYWPLQKEIRITDRADPRQSTKFETVNDPQYGPAQPVIDPMTGLPHYDPASRQITMQRPFLGMKNDIAEIHIDVEIDNTPDVASVEQEQWEILSELAKFGALGPNAGKILLRASKLPMKAEIIEELEQGGQQGPSPEQRAAMELQMREKAAGIDRTTAQAEEARARAARTAGEAQAGQIALAERMALTGPTLLPPQGF